MGDKIRHLTGQIGQIRPEFFCLLILLGLDFMIMALGRYGTYFIHNYTILPAMVFLGILLAQKSCAKAGRQLLLGGVFVLWYAAVQFLRYMDGMTYYPLGLAVSVFWLAFPFAAATKDGSKQSGLKIAGAVYVGAMLWLAFLTGLLQMELLPGFLKPHVLWVGSRLSVMWHPNTCACVFMLGIGFSLYFISLAKKKLAKLALWAVVALAFYLIVLTNSRTTLGMAMLLVVGYVFFWILQKGGWKRTLIAVAVMALLAGVLLVGVISLKQSHDQRQLEAYLAQEESDPSQVIVDSETGEMKLKGSNQGGFLNDLKTFNGRTPIWSAVAAAYQKTPGLHLLGIDDPRALEAWPSYAVHTHNAWVETWVRLGTPGLVLALLFTVLAVWRILNVLFGKNMDMGKKSIALLMLSLLGIGMLEPALFFAYRSYYFTNVLFFLAFGYMDQWCKKTV